MKNSIYADHAATTKLSPAAFNAMRLWLEEEYANPSQPYSFSRNAKKALASARADIALCINAEPGEIYFTSGGTESDNWAIKGSAFVDAEKRATITSVIEHHAVLNACKSIEKLGYPVAYLPVSTEGIVDPKTLSQFITEQTRLVSVMTVNNEIGTIQPIRDLAVVAHQNGAVFHTDAVQAVGHMPIDVKENGVDLLSASAHKFNGPRGIGFLYIKNGTELASFLDGGSQEGGMRAGTENVASIVGMAAALCENIKEMKNTREHIQNLELRLLDQLTISGIPFIRNGANHIPGIMSLSFPEQNGEMLLHRLDLAGIMVSTGAACDSVHTQLSHVLQAIGTERTIAEGTIRISLGKENTVEDVDAIVKALVRIINYQR